MINTRETVGWKRMNTGEEHRRGGRGGGNGKVEKEKKVGEHEEREDAG